MLHARTLHRPRPTPSRTKKQPITAALYSFLLMKNAPVENRAVLDALARCIAACEYCADACLSEDNIQMMVGCIRTDRDCADICRVTAAFIARNSAHAPHIMKECIEICQKCYDECSQHKHDHCQQCAEACKACLDACKSYQA